MKKSKIREGGMGRKEKLRADRYPERAELVS
jgi:hypothetical protein